MMKRWKAEASCARKKEEYALEGGGLESEHRVDPEQARHPLLVLLCAHEGAPQGSQLSHRRAAWPWHWERISKCSSGHHQFPVVLLDARLGCFRRPGVTFVSLFVDRAGTDIITNSIAISLLPH